jgi:hypothetical protein
MRYDTQSEPLNAAEKKAAEKKATEKKATEKKATEKKAIEQAAKAKCEQVIGMNRGRLYACLGKPRSINRTVTAHGTHEQLVYGSRTYIYLDDGIVTSFQD